MLIHYILNIHLGRPKFVFATGWALLVYFLNFEGGGGNDCLLLVEHDSVYSRYETVVYFPKTDRVNKSRLTEIPENNETYGYGPGDRVNHSSKGFRSS